MPHHSFDAMARSEAKLIYLDRKSTRPELQSQSNLVCRLLLEKKKQRTDRAIYATRRRLKCVRLLSLHHGPVLSISPPGGSQSDRPTHVIDDDKNTYDFTTS